MAKRLIPSLNRVLTEKLLQPKKSTGGILLPASTKQEAPINRFYATVPSKPGKNLKEAPNNRLDATVPSSPGTNLNRKLKWVWGFSLVAATFASVCDELRPSKRASRRKKRQERQRQRQREAAASYPVR